jgi:hypothetical protein
MRHRSRRNTPRSGSLFSPPSYGLVIAIQGALHGNQVEHPTRLIARWAKSRNEPFFCPRDQGFLIPGNELRELPRCDKLDDFPVDQERFRLKFPGTKECVDQFDKVPHLHAHFGQIRRPFSLA